MIGDDKTQDADTITIRRALYSDCTALTSLCFRSKQSNGYDDGFMEACRGELTVTRETLEQSECWVAQHLEGQHSDNAPALCGCACLTLPSNTLSEKQTPVGEVGLFFIDPGWQGNGVGRLLWETILKRAESHGLHELVLDADPFAEGFYAKLGFEVIGRVTSGSIPGRTLPHMRLIISTPNDQR